MQIVILAGGLGTRLRPLTETVAKPMIKVAGVPFLEYQLKFIKSQGFSDILILVAYLGEQIESYFKDGSFLGLNISYSYEKELLGTGGALKNSEQLLEDEFIVLNGDTFLPIDYKKVVDSYHDSGSLAMVVAYDNSDNISPNNISLNNDNTVGCYSREILDKTTHVNAGCLIMKKSILDKIKDNKKCSLEEELFAGLIPNKELASFITNQMFYDIGTFQKLKIFEKFINNNS